MATITTSQMPDDNSEAKAAELLVRFFRESQASPEDMAHHIGITGATIYFSRFIDGASPGAKVKHLAALAFVDALEAAAEQNQRPIFRDSWPRYLPADERLSAWIGSMRTRIN